MALNAKWVRGYTVAAVILAEGTNLAVAYSRNWSTDRLGLIAVMILIAGLIALRSQRGQNEEERIAEWEASLTAFREALGKLTNYCNTALQATMGGARAPTDNWSQTAMRSRWPDLGDDPIRGWGDRKADWMEDSERLCLATARWIERVDHNTNPFQTARRDVGNALRQWIRWHQDPKLTRLIGPAIEEHRNAIVMWAYLEIAHADAVTLRSPAPEWRILPALWPVLGGPPIARESGGD